VFPAGAAEPDGALSARGDLTIAAVDGALSARGDLTIAAWDGALHAELAGFTVSGPVTNAGTVPAVARWR
jgi:hypothetical protein